MTIVETYSDLELEEAVLLPEREAMAFINIAVINPINVSLAFNVLSIDSSVMSAAMQSITVMQS